MSLVSLEVLKMFLSVHSNGFFSAFIVNMQTFFSYIVLMAKQP